MTQVRKKVCLIDDDPDLREIYSLTLNREGYDVSLGKDGAEGLAVIREKHPDIILLDLQMPIKNGFEVLKELSADRKLAKIPVIILSNVDGEAAFRQAGEYETRFYLVKALTSPEKVVKVVREVI